MGLGGILGEELERNLYGCLWRVIPRAVPAAPGLMMAFGERMGNRLLFRTKLNRGQDSVYYCPLRPEALRRLSPPWVTSHSNKGVKQKGCTFPLFAR